MRKITQQAVDALLNGKAFRLGNTQVIPGVLGTRMELHGHAIAYVSNTDGSVYIDTCGYQTNTTKERLNGIPGVSVHQKAGQWYLNGHRWDGKVTQVK